MNTVKQMIEKVVSGTSPNSLINEDKFSDNRDAVASVMLIVQNDGKLYQSLMSGHTSYDAAAKQGIEEHLKWEIKRIREDLYAAKGEIAKEIKKWIEDIKRQESK